MKQTGIVISLVVGLVAVGLVIARLSIRTSSSRKMTDFEARTPEQLVLAFIRDCEAWEISQLSANGSLADVVAKLQNSINHSESRIPESVTRHFEDVSNRLAARLASWPYHRVATEQILHTESSGDRATVTTHFEDGKSTSVDYVYDLRRRGTIWRIVTFETFHSKVQEGTRATWPIDSPDFVTKADLVQRARINFKRAFRPTPGLKLLPDQHGEAKVVSAGKIALPSGKIVLWEPGDYDVEARPFALRVPPGTWDVSFSEVDDGVGALMIFFGAIDTVQAYISARLLGKTDHLPFNNRGYLCVADALAHRTLGTRALEKIFLQGQAAYETKLAWFDLKAPQSHEAFAVAPAEASNAFAYWGVDGTGRPVCFAVDFGLYGAIVDHQCTIPYTPDLIGHRLHSTDLIQAGVDVRLLQPGSRYEIQSKGPRFIDEVIFCDEMHRKIDSTADQNENYAMDGIRGYYLKIPSDFKSGELVVKWSTWTNYLEEP